MSDKKLAACFKEGGKKGQVRLHSAPSNDDDQMAAALTAR